MKGINFKKIVLTLSIVIVLNLFFNMGIKAFYKGPEYNDFCSKANVSYFTKESCESSEGFWVPNTVGYGYKGELPDGQQVAPIASVPCDVTGRTDCVADTGYHCDMSKYLNECNEAYKLKNDVYSRNVFIVLVVLGILSIVIGFFFNKSGAVSIGLSFGGIISLLIGTIRYWSSMKDFLRFAVSGVALAVLIWLGIKMFGDKKEEETKHEGV